MRKSRGVPKQKKPQRKVAAPKRTGAAKSRLVKSRPAKGAAPRATRRGSLAKQLLEAQQRQAATAEILQIISSSPGDLQPVFQAMLAKAMHLCQVQCGFIYQMDHGAMKAVAEMGVPPAFAEYRRHHLHTGGAATPVDVMRATKKPAHVHDARDSDAYCNGNPNAVAGVDLGGARTVLYVPMIRDGDIVGVINLYRQEVRPFTDEQIWLLEHFASQAVIAIENTRLFNKTQEALERQTATADILKVIASSPGDVQPVFDAIAASASRLLASLSASVILFIDGMAHLKALTSITPAADELLKSLFPRPLADFAPAEVAQTGEVMQVPDTEAVDNGIRDVGRARGFRSAAFMPLINKGAVIGVIGIARVEPGPFAEHHLDLLHTFADQAVIAIENTRLFNETQEALERQTATADILKVIASSPDDVQPVFEAIAERSNRIVDGRSTAVYNLVDDVLHLMAFTPTSPEADATLRAFFPRPLSQMRWGEAISRGEVYQVPDMQALSIPEDGRKLAERRGFRAMMVVPLVSEQKTIGVISVTRAAPGKFADHHVQLLQTFADQAVIAIENVRLFDEVQARTRDLADALQQQTATGDVLKVIASSPTDMGPALQAICESACKFCDSYDAGVLLKKGDELHFSAHHGPIQAGQRARPISREWVVGRSVVDRIPVHVSDFRAPEAAEFPEGQRQSREQGHRCTLSVPLLRDGEAIGAIALRRLEPVPFSDKQIALLQTFADQAVIAIGNVRLFEEVQAKSRDLMQSLDDLRTAQDRLVQTEKLASLGQLTAGIAHEIKNPLNFVNNFSALSAELIGELTDLLRDAALTDKMREDVEELAQLLKDNLGKVVQHGKRADSIVKNMLLHSREGSGEQRSAEINALVDESLNLAYHGARAEKNGFNITLQRDYDANAGAAELFPQEITRALLNLISNGFYAATKRKSENDGDRFEPVLRATTKDCGNAVEIRIRDNGTGIPPNVREKMFNPFFTTKPAGEGTGLGLSMAHDIIVKQHGGQIDVATEPGEFTEFTIVLPRSGPK